VGDYAVANLKEVENAAAKFAMPDGIEARFARRPLGAEQSGVSYQKLGPGVRMPFGHRHEDQEETYVVVAGSGRIKLDDEVLDLRAWDTIRIAPATMRCVEGGDEGIEYLAFGAGDPEQAQMVQGWWSD
jgi:uncharacterized cupin superfamily protein